MDHSIVGRAHASGLKVWVWTIDDETEAKAWADAGVDGIFTDVPKAMRGWFTVE